MTEQQKEEVKLKKVPVPCGVSQRTVFESIMNDGNPYFLVYCPNFEFTWAKDMHGEGNILFTPLAKDDAPYEPYFAEKEAVKGIAEGLNVQQLFQEVLHEYQLFLDMEAEYKHLEAIQTLETYNQHKLNSTSYLYHKGDKDSGKSRALELHYYLDYRPLLCDQPNPPNVFRYLGFHGKGNGTVLQDEAHNLTHETQLLSIYNMGYRSTARYPRLVQLPSGEMKQRFFNIFCSKVFAGLWLPKNEPFKSRCIEIPMVEGYPEKDEFLAEDLERIAKLRVKLLMWRMKTYFEPLPQVETILKCRIKELWKPKLQIESLVSNIQDNPIVEFSLRAYNQKIEEKKSSLEAQICKAVVLTINEQKDIEIPFSLLWEFLNSVVKGEIENNRIVTSEYGELSKHVIGLKLGSIFGAEKRLVYGTGRTWRFNRERLLKLMKKYLLEEKLWGTMT